MFRDRYIIDPTRQHRLYVPTDYLRKSPIADIDDYQIAGRDKAVITQYSHTLGAPARLTTPQPLRIGWVRDIDHLQPVAGVCDVGIATGHCDASNQTAQTP